MPDKPTKTKAARTKAVVKRRSPQRLTPRARVKFIAVLSDTGNVTTAARAIGLCRETAYRIRKRNAGFAKEWDAALVEAVDGLEAEAYRRGVSGVDEPVFQGGKQVGSTRRYSDMLLLSLLKAHAPDRYRERQSVEHSGPAGGAIQVAFTAPDRYRSPAEWENGGVAMIESDGDALESSQ
jgi:hypothetical protein